MNNLYDQFKNNQIWMYCAKEKFDLIDEFRKQYPPLSFSDGSPFTAEEVRPIVGNHDVWFRYSNGIRYTRHYPRTSSARDISPEIYDHGEIYDIDVFINDNKIVISEDEIEKLFLE